MIVVDYVMKYRLDEYFGMTNLTVNRFILTVRHLLKLKTFTLTWIKADNRDKTCQKNKNLHYLLSIEVSDKSVV